MKQAVKQAVRQAVRQPMRHGFPGGLPGDLDDAQRLAVIESNISILRLQRDRAAIRRFRLTFDHDMAAWHVRLAMARYAQGLAGQMASEAQPLHHRFDPAQPRDDHGRWTDMGGAQVTPLDLGTIHPKPPDGEGGRGGTGAAATQVALGPSATGTDPTPDGTDNLSGGPLPQDDTPAFALDSVTGEAGTTPSLAVVNPTEMIRPRRGGGRSGSPSGPSRHPARQARPGDNGGPPLDPAPKIMPPVVYPWDKSSPNVPDDQGRIVNLWDENRAAQGHIFAEHAGMSNDYIAKRLRSMSRNISSVGTFADSYEADRLVNAALRRNRETLRKFVSGELGDRLVVEEGFDEITGKEAWRQDEFGDIRIRSTNGVKIIAYLDSDSSNGFRLTTAYPITIQRATGREMKQISFRTGEVPDDFYHFVSCMVIDELYIYDNGDDWLADQTRCASSGPRLAVVKLCMDELIDGGYSDAELRVIFRQPRSSLPIQWETMRSDLDIIRFNLGKPAQLNARTHGPGVHIKGPWQSWPTE